MRPAALVLLVLAGCATFSENGGFAHTQKLAREKLGQDLNRLTTDAEKHTAQARINSLLQGPLSAEQAVEIALLANPGLHANYQKLGISEAEVVQAGRLPNPHFSMLRASHQEGGVRDYKIEQTLTLNLFALITRPLEYRLATHQFERTQHEVAHDMLQLAHDTRKAWVDAVASEESVRHFLRAQTAAQAGAELARRLATAGNVSAQAQLREQSLLQETELALTRAQLEAHAAREKLTRLMGISGAQLAFKLPERLPDLPRTAPQPPALVQQALDERLDLAMVRLDTAALAASLGLTRTTRFINVLEAGPMRVLEGPAGTPYKNGFEVRFELPLFDWGGARVAGAEARYQRQLHLATQAALEAQSEVREALFARDGKFEIARRYRDDILPLKKRLSDEALLRYNGMLIGVQDLLREARNNTGSVKEAIDATRDFWLAQADLDMALIGKPRLPPAARTADLGAGAATH